MLYISHSPFRLIIRAGSLDYSAAFEIFDVDHDGNATPDELHAIFIRYVLRLGYESHSARASPKAPPDL